MPTAHNSSEQTDEVLMCRAQADDTAAFAQLYDRHAVRALRLARSVCRDASRAEEAVQEGFLSIWRNRGNYRPEVGSFQSWSMRIVQNRAIDSSRRAASRPQGPVEGPAEGPADELSAPLQDEVIARSESEALRASLRRLPDAQAEVITLAFFGGLSHSEIATELALPQSTVKGRMRLGLNKLRRQLTVS